MSSSVARGGGQFQPARLGEQGFVGGCFGVAGRNVEGEGKFGH